MKFNRDLIGEHESSMQINFGAINEREGFRTLELFAARVMLRFQSPGTKERLNSLNFLNFKPKGCKGEK
jgi:hypothetical protein